MKNITIIKHELSKIVAMKPLLFFLALCLGLNALVIISDGMGDSYPRFFAEFARENGIQINGETVSAADLESEPYFSEMLQNDLHGAGELWQDVDMSDYAEAYIKAYELKGKYAELMRAKFDKEQMVYDTLSQSEDFMTLYCGSQTGAVHGQIFGTLFKLMLMESFIAAALISIFSVSQEKSCRTEAVIYSSNRGRAVYLHKLTASLVCSEAFFLILCALSLILILIFTPYPALFGSSVSSCFNYLSDLIAGTRPFVTFVPMNIWQYALGCFGVSVGSVAVMTLIGFSVMLLTDNSYLSFLLIAGCNMAVLMLISYVGTSWLFLLLVDTPIMLWMQSSVWFTDGGGNHLFPFFETTGMIGNLVLSMAFATGAVILKKRRDILC